MPVVRIRALPQRSGVDVAAVLGRVSLALADLLGEPPAGTWATWETIEPGRYAEGEDAPLEQPRSTHPPLVSLVAFEGRPPELVERMLICVAETLARELQLEPGNVFVAYDEARSGRLYTGGQVARGKHG
jgi:phenylpyruvate tautomerase PptA (4-oxalocrotonate tautomerase family)